MRLPAPALRIGPASPAARARIAVVQAVAAAHRVVTGGDLRTPVLAGLDRLLPRGPLPDVEAAITPTARLTLAGHGAMARGALLCGSYEHRECEVLAGALRPGGAVFDVGANVGWFTLMLAAHRPAAHVHAVEPLPATADLLQATVDRARLDNVTVHRVALGDRVGTMPLVSTSDNAYAHAAGTADAGVGGPRIAGWRAATAMVECPAATLDWLWHRTGRPRVDAVKVDVEGGEPAVLAGAEDLLAQCRPLLVVETQSDERRALVQDVLGPLGYAPRSVPGVLSYNTVFTVGGEAA